VSFTNEVVLYQNDKFLIIGVGEKINPEGNSSELCLIGIHIMSLKK